MNGRNLQSFYHITINVIDDGTEAGGKQITFHSTIHKNKSKVCPVTYSTAFSDFEILNDHYFLSWVNSHYGKVTL